MIDVEGVKKAVSQTNATWEADHTPFTEMSDHDRSVRLGYKPGPKDFTLKAAEDYSTKSHSAFMVRESRVGLTATAMQYPLSIDWRNVSGQNYITPIRDQGSCGSCVAFGTLATVEGTRRVQGRTPSLNIDYSEAHLFYCYGGNQGRRCEGQNGGWWPAGALDSCKAGVVDEACFPYTAGDQNCRLCNDWQKRLTKVAAWQSTNSVDTMKQWISSKGPLVTCYSVYSDFFSYKSGVYRHVSGPLEGGHCVSVVGYNDQQRYWVCKNSWGTRFGESGFFRIAYGQCGIDATMYVVTGITP